LYYQAILYNCRFITGIVRWLHYPVPFSSETVPSQPIALPFSAFYSLHILSSTMVKKVKDLTNIVHALAVTGEVVKSDPTFIPFMAATTNTQSYIN